MDVSTLEFIVAMVAILALAAAALWPSSSGSSRISVKTTITNGKGGLFSAVIAGLLVAIFWKFLEPLADKVLKLFG